MGSRVHADPPCYGLQQFIKECPSGKLLSVESNLFWTLTAGTSVQGAAKGAASWTMSTAPAVAITMITTYGH